MNPHVVCLTPQAGQCLLLKFDNGETRLFDLSPWLDKGECCALRDNLNFARARIVGGSIEWPGELDLSYDTLYLHGVAL